MLVITLTAIGNLVKVFYTYRSELDEARTTCVFDLGAVWAYLDEIMFGSIDGERHTNASHLLLTLCGPRLADSSTHLSGCPRARDSSDARDALVLLSEATTQLQRVDAAGSPPLYEHCKLVRHSGRHRCEYLRSGLRLEGFDVGRHLRSRHADADFHS